MEEMVEVKEIVETVIKGKWIVAMSTVVCLLFTAILSWLVLPEKYESKAIVQIASSVQDTGIMESFVATEFTPRVYAHRVKNESVINEAFQKENIQNEFDQGKLDVKNEENTNILTLTYTSNSPENAQKELQLIMSTTKDKMNESVQNTLKDLELTYSKDADSLTKEIDSIIDQYNTIIRDNRLPEVLILQTILNSEMIVNISGEQTKALVNVSGEIQNQLLQLQAKIQTKSEEYRNVLSKYQSVKTGLENFKPDPFIRVIAEPSLPEEPSSPNHALNLAIGLLLGIIVGLGIVFYRKYWSNLAN